MSRAYHDELIDDSERARDCMTMRILVTGGTGFVGSHLSRALAEAGHDVVITGRNRYQAGRSFHPRIEFFRADLRDKTVVAGLCKDKDAVVHSGALSTPWGKRADFFNINVGGTKNIVAGCLEHGVKRLVHVSSTAVFFEYTDKTELPDDAPFARPFCNAYAESKAEAERVVNEAVNDGLNAIILRARAVFGPGDTTIIPRVLRAAEAGRLRTLDDGANILDLTYVDNLVHAIVLALERGPAGAAMTITNDEPVALWPLLDEVLAQAGVKRPGKRIAWKKLDRLAAVLEAVYARLPGRPEPPVTRYGAGLLAKTQTFNISQAKRVLGYAPRLSVREGMSRTVRSLRDIDDSHARAYVRLRLFFTGHCTNWQHHVLAGAPRKKVPFHSMAALLEHPTFGRTLVDTGYSSHFMTETRRFPFSIYARVTPVTSHEHEHVHHQLRALGIEPHDVDRILITHFHGDHVAGLRDFDRADLVCTEAAWRSVEGKGAIRAVRRAHVPGLLPDDVASRLHLLSRFADAGIGPFARTHDLFGDGSVRLIPLPGHAAGQVGALVQTGPRERKLLVADAVWTSVAIRERRLPHPITRLIAASHREYVESLDRLCAFSAAFPDVEMIPTHCPEAFARWSSAAEARALPAAAE